jgi:phage gpG-like protein
MIRIELDGAELRQALAQLQQAVGDLSPTMRQIGELVIDRTKQRFREGKAPDGSALGSGGSSMAAGMTVAASTDWPRINAGFRYRNRGILPSWCPHRAALTAQHGTAP